MFTEEGFGGFWVVFMENFLSQLTFLSGSINGHDKFSLGNLSLVKYVDNLFRWPSILVPLCY